MMENGAIFAKNILAKGMNFVFRFIKLDNFCFFQGYTQLYLGFIVVGTY